jgi:hypothetical protein
MSSTHPTASPSDCQGPLALGNDERTDLGGEPFEIVEVLLEGVGVGVDHDVRDSVVAVTQDRCGDRVRLTLECSASPRRKSRFLGRGDRSGNCGFPPLRGKRGSGSPLGSGCCASIGGSQQREMSSPSELITEVAFRPRVEGAWTSPARSRITRTRGVVELMRLQDDRIARGGGAGSRR